MFQMKSVHGLIFCAVLIAASEGKAEPAPRVVVFDLELRRIKLSREGAEILRDYMANKLAATKVYRVVPGDKIRAALNREQVNSKKVCFAQSCQIRVGRALAADRSLSIQVMRIGRRCTLQATLYNLESQVSEKGASATGGCREEHLQAAINRVVHKLASNEPKTVKPPPARLAESPATGRTEKEQIKARTPDTGSQVKAARTVDEMQADSHIKWVRIEEGVFRMGSNEGDPDEGPVRLVRVGSFYLGQTEVTVGQYSSCVRSARCSPPYLAGNCREFNTNSKANSNMPVTCVNWNQVRTYCAWAGGRLPSEAEWEYAARSQGKPTKFPWGVQSANCDLAVIRDGRKGCGRKRPWPVCSREQGNTAQGLCDMAGNVGEWVEDCYHEDYKGAPSDGAAWTTGCGQNRRVLRGGSWRSLSSYVRSANRHNQTSAYRNFSNGFRCARSVD